MNQFQCIDYKNLLTAYNSIMPLIVIFQTIFHYKYPPNPYHQSTYFARLIVPTHFKHLFL